MTNEFLLTLLFCFLVGILGLTFLFQLKKPFPYLPLRSFLLLIAIAVLTLVFAAFELLPNWIGNCSLFLIEAISLAWVIYFEIGLLVIITLVVALIIRRRRPTK